MSDMNSERQRAEIFDILSHPVRIRILKTLSRKPMSFSELKKETSIESSGHLDYHMNKLDGLIKSDENGRYVLSDQGKDALFTFKKVEEYSNDEQKTRGHSVLASRKVVMAMLCLSIIILAAGLYASDIKLSVSYVTTQDQYFYKLTQGDVNTPEAVVSGPNNFSVPAESIFSFTNVVVENYSARALNLKVYCSPITETAEPVVGNLTFSSGPGLVAAIYSVPETLESEVSVKPYLILGQLVSYASLVAIGALSIVVVSRRRPLKKEIR